MREIKRQGKDFKGKKVGGKIRSGAWQAAGVSGAWKGVWVGRSARSSVGELEKPRPMRARPCPGGRLPARGLAVRLPACVWTGSLQRLEVSLLGGHQEVVAER